MIVELVIAQRFNFEALSVISPNNAPIRSGADLASEVKALGALIGKDRALDLYTITLLLQDDTSEMDEFVLDVLAYCLKSMAVHTRSHKQSAYLLTASLREWHHFIKHYPSPQTSKIADVLHFNRLSESRVIW